MTAEAASAVASLGELVDGLAARTGAWVLVEQAAVLLAHGVGVGTCPPAFAAAVVGKSAGPLRAAVVWERGPGARRGRVDGAEATVLDLGDGAQVWFVGAGADVSVAPSLAAALGWPAGPVTDPVVAELLHPRGPARRGREAGGRLVALSSDGSVVALGRRVLSLLAGTGARVHTEDDVVLVAGDGALDVAWLLERLPGARAGVATVPEGANDWVGPAGLAAAAVAVAEALGIPLADPADPRVSAELVVREAAEAARDLATRVPGGPLSRLAEHDARTGADLLASLAAWCRAGFDVPTAAAVLFVHANTVRYRLRRAAEVSAVDLACPRQLLALQLLLSV